MRLKCAENRPALFHIEAAPAARPGGERSVSLKGWPADDPGQYVEFESRIVLQLASPESLDALLRDSPLQLARTVRDDVFILQAPDALVALQEAERLARLDEVTVCHPMMRREVMPDGPYAALPQDPYFGLRSDGAYQWYLENRYPDGNRFAADINVRAAWPFSRGAGVTIAIADSGFETDHPELEANSLGAPHFNFKTGQADGYPPGAGDIHGTAVAGLAAAAENGFGMVGVAPEAKLASWVVFSKQGGGDVLAGDEALMDVFQYQSNSVPIQNHSWGVPGLGLVPVGLLPQIGISNAIEHGRDGLGTVIVRSAGNRRSNGQNANDDAYRSDPRIICVASSRGSGRVTDYSNPGACTLVATIGGENGAYFFTTDRQGELGYNAFRTLEDPDFWNYSFVAADPSGFKGTSAAAPQVAGIAALMLSINPSLSHRDVQQILIFASRHFDLADPDLRANGAGFLVSHNLGFGLPDAGEAVQLARRWNNRPPLTRVTLAQTNSIAIPDDGLRLVISGDDIPGHLRSIRTLPSTGVHADVATAVLPLVDAGLATNTLALDLTDKAALIERGTNSFADKINFAAEAGAAFAVIHNFATNSGSGAPGGDQLIPIVADFAPIPAVFISHSDGQSLKSLFQTNESARARIHLAATNYTFTITNQLLCEHVGVRIRTDHPLRGDLRITLVSPAGTRSVLQAYNTDTSAGPADWTYYSTQHFYESSVGDWQLHFSDQNIDFSGSALEAALTVFGVEITDEDADGLDDNWELAHFGSLAQGPEDDPDDDGYSNAREQILGMNPTMAEVPFELDLSRWNQQVARLSWAGQTNRVYQIWSGTNLTSLSPVADVPGQFPVTEWFTSSTNATRRFFQVRIAP